MLATLSRSSLPLFLSPSLPPFLGCRYEISAKLASGWVQTVHTPSSTSFAQGGNQWVGYDTPTTLRAKVNLAASRGLGGCMVWALDLDDFHGGYPLVTSARDHMLAQGYTLASGGPQVGARLLTDSAVSDPAATDPAVTDPAATGSGGPRAALAALLVGQAEPGPPRRLRAGRVPS